MGNLKKYELDEKSKKRLEEVQRKQREFIASMTPEERRKQSDKKRQAYSSISISREDK